MKENAGHANLIPAKKGEIRNPYGRNGKDRRLKLSAAIVEHFDEHDKAAVIKAVITEAQNGNIKAAEFLFDRVFGKPDTVGSEDKGDSAKPVLIQNNFGELTRQQLEDIVNQSVQDVNYTETDL
jgi:hypothetical protein